MTRPSEDRWFTTAEAAEVLRESVLTTMRKCSRGEIAATKAGRSWRISATALDEYLAPSRPESPVEPEPEFVTASAKRRARRAGLLDESRRGSKRGHAGR